LIGHLALGVGNYVLKTTNELINSLQNLNICTPCWPQRKKYVTSCNGKSLFSSSRQQGKMYIKLLQLYTMPIG